jgi:hypothetical protein
MNSDLEPRFNSQLLSSVHQLENALTAAYPNLKRSGPIHFIGNTQHHQLLGIVRLARDISFEIQHSFTTCRLFVTVSSHQEVNGSAQGTYSLGLNKVSGSVRTVLLNFKTWRDGGESEPMIF